MCLCVRLQNPHEKPVRSDAKYTEKARKTLLALAMHGQQPTTGMLKKLKQEYYRKDYDAWKKRKSRLQERESHGAQRSKGQVAEKTICPQPCLDAIGR